MALDPTAAVAALRAKAARLRREGRLAEALEAYEAILRFSPDDHSALTEMAGIAEDLGMHEIAVRLWSQLAVADPSSAQAADGYARALGQAGRYDEAVAALKSAIPLNPEEPRLWNTLGIILSRAGKPDQAIAFFDEAIRLDPQLASAVYNRGGALFDLGRLDEAVTDFEAARKLARKPADIAMIEFAAATLHLARGELERGWRGYEVRHSRDWAKAVTFQAPGRRWTPAMALKAKRLLVIAEQGVGDEIMFASLLPEVIGELGSESLLTLAVDERLVPLFRRSFPDATVLAHATERDGARTRRSVPALPGGVRIDLWAPLASLAQRFRPTITDFPQRQSYLRPDPQRVAHWRAWLGSERPVVGLTWRSGKIIGDRRREYPPVEALAPVVAIPKVRFVNIQYGDCADELSALRAMGAEVLEPPALDLKDDLDDLAALCSALDLVISVSNATGQLAGAVGGRLLFLSRAANWPRLGTENYPWHSGARVLAPAQGASWERAMTEAAAAVEALSLEQRR